MEFAANAEHHPQTVTCPVECEGTPEPQGGVLLLWLGSGLSATSQPCLPDETADDASW